MNYVEQFQINIYAFLILLILYIVINIRLTLVSFSRKILHLIIYFSAVAIIVEPLTWYFDNKIFFGSYVLEFGTNSMLILLGPIIAGLMLSYAVYYIERDISNIRKRFFYMYPAIFTSFMLIVNFFYPIYFAVDKATNIYTVADYLPFHYVLITLMYLYMVVFTFRQRNQVEKNVIYMFMLFFLLPFLGMIIQLFYINIFFSWNSLVLGIFVLYVFVESTNGEKDYLSQLYNRRSFEKYCNQLCENNRKFKLVSFDLDKFKPINDTFGHVEGDKTIVSYSKILKRVSLPNKMVARLGGDEFMVIIENDYQVEEVVKKIYVELKKSDNPILNSLTFSYGAFEQQGDLTVDGLYASVDREMYLYKNKNNALKRRSTDT